MHVDSVIERPFVATQSNIAVHRMKRFQMITEADARVLDYGSTVVLWPGATSRRSRTTRCMTGASR